MVTEKNPDALARAPRKKSKKPGDTREHEPSTTETHVPDTESALEHMPTSDTVKPDIDSSDVVY